MEKISEPPRPRDERLYNIIIFSVLISLVIVSAGAYFFRTTLYDRKDYFAEVFFPQPDDLPNRVELDKEYNFTYSVKNNEQDQKNYTLISGLELYRIYDLSESKHSCLSGYRNKIFLDWTNETKNLSVIPNERMFDKIEPLAVFPDHDEKISWDTYNIEFRFSRSGGVGQLAFFFSNTSDIKYAITLDSTKNQSLFNGDVTREGIEINDQNNQFLLQAGDGRIRAYLNEMLIADEAYENIYDGSIGFMSQDSYYVITQMKAYRNSEIIVPDDTDDIREYTVTDNYVFNKLNALKGMVTRSVRLYRYFERWNETIDCEKEPFYCEYFDIPNDISFYLEDTNLTKVVEKIPVINREVNYILSANDREDAVINWTDYSMSFTHDQLESGSPGAIILKFSDKWAIMVTRNNSYYIMPDGDKTRIDEFRNPGKPNQTQDMIEVDVDEELIVLKINNQTIFSRQSPDDYTHGNLDVYVKNVFLFINPISVKNDNPVCLDPYSFEFCELILEISSGSRPVVSDQREEFRIDYADYFPEDDVFNLFEFPEFQGSGAGIDLGEENISATGDNESEEYVPVKHILEIDVDNPFIPDRRIIFNTASTEILQNNTGYSLDYTYQSLDGARVLEIGVQDKLGNEIASMSVLEKESKFVIFDGMEERTYTAYRFVNLSTNHVMKIELEDEKIMFYFDNKEVFRLNNRDVQEGYFFIGSRNTYLEMGNIHFNILGSGYSRSLGISDNPCDLKLIYREAFPTNISLLPGASMNMTDMFNITRDFDYGKAFVRLYGSGGMNATDPLEIHFWIMRDD